MNVIDGGDATSIAILFRFIIFLIVSIGGCISLYLGWKLYRDGINLRVAGKIHSNSGWKASLSSSGPGVFFALFGVALLSYVASRNLNIDRSEGRISWWSGVTFTEKQKRVDLNNAVEFLQTINVEKLSDQDAIRLESAKRTLNEIQGSLHKED